jgi:hypothetical protein
MKKLIMLLFFVPTFAFAAMNPMGSMSSMNSTGKLPPMPPHCNTPKTMNLWYTKVAKQNIAEHHSFVVCKKELLKLGATIGFTKTQCK